MTDTLEIDLKYRVTDLRKHGLEARWARTSGGRPIIVVRNPAATVRFQRDHWWTVDCDMFASMKRDGVVEAFTNHTLLGDIFCVL